MRLTRTFAHLHLFFFFFFLVHSQHFDGFCINQLKSIHSVTEARLLITFSNFWCMACSLNNTQCTYRNFIIFLFVISYICLLFKLLAHYSWSAVFGMSYRCLPVSSRNSYHFLTCKVLLYMAVTKSTKQSSFQVFSLYLSSGNAREFPTFRKANWTRL